MTSWSQLDSSMWPLIGLSLAHFIWQGALIALAAAGALFWLRKRSPQARYVACGIALGMMAAAPLVTLMSIRHVHFEGGNSNAGPIVHAPMRGGAPTRLEATDEESFADGAVTTRDIPRGSVHTIEPIEIAGDLEHETLPLAGRQGGAGVEFQGDSDSHETMPAAELESVETVGPFPPSAAVSRTKTTTSAAGPSQPLASDKVIVRALGWSAILWLMGVMLFALRLSIGWMQLRSLTRTAQVDDPSADLAARFERMARKMQCPGKLRLKISRLVTTPVTFGLLKPIVLIPAAMLAEVSPQWIDCILAHELAHIRRRDVWINLFQRVIESLLFFHPAVWWLSDRMRLERELCCDDIAVGVTGSPADYAEALVTTARGARSVRVFAMRDALASGITGGKMSISARVRRILSGNRGCDGAPMRNWLAGPIVLMAVGSLLLVSRIEAADETGDPQSAKVAAQKDGGNEAEQAAAEAFPQTSVIETDFRAAQSWQERVKMETEAVRRFLPIIEAYQSFHDAIYRGDDEAVKRVFAPDGRAATDQDVRALRSDIEAMGFADAKSIFDSPWEVGGCHWVEESRRVLLTGKRFSTQIRDKNWYYQLYGTMQRTTGDAWMISHLAIMPSGIQKTAGFKVEEGFIQNERDAVENFLLNAVEAIQRDQTTEPAVYHQLYLASWNPRNVYTYQILPRPLPTTTKSGRIELVDRRKIDDQTFTLLGPVKNLALVASPIDERVNVDGTAAALDAIDSEPQVELIKYPVYTQASGIVAETPVLREVLHNHWAALEVKKGQLLLRLVDDEIKLDLAEAEVRQELARSRYNRVQALAADQKVSQHELEEAKAQLRLAELHVERQALALSRTRVTAPADGTLSYDFIGQGQFKKGQQINAGTLIGYVAAPAESTEETE